MDLEHEHPFLCPWCWQPISMLLDLSVCDQTYVEDCEICCRPIEIHYEAGEEGLLSFEATASG